MEGLFRELYPKYEEKRLGVGVRRIQVVHLKGARCFEFTTSDGRVERLSLRSCFSKAKGSSEVRKAFRFEVFSDCVGYREWYFGGRDMAPCELTGELVAVGECEVDHIPPDTFQKILERYIRDKGLELRKVGLRDASDGLGKLLSDRALARDWRAYHLSRARLRVVGRQAHVQETRKQQRGSL